MSGILFGGKKSSAAPKGQTAVKKPAKAAPPEDETEDEAEEEPQGQSQHDALAQMMFGNKNWANANPSERDPYDTPGHYWQKIERFTIKLSDNPTKLGTPQAILKKRILWASDQNPPNTLQAGSRCAQVFDYTKTGAVSASRGFMAKVLDVSPTELKPEHGKMLTDPVKQPLAGFVVEVRTNVDPSKVGKDGKPFTWVNYERRVPFAEVLTRLEEGHLDASVVEELFPDGLLQTLVEQEAAAQG